MRLVDLRLAFDAKFAQDRPQNVAKTTKRNIGLPDVDDTKAVWAFACDVDE